MSLGNCIPGLVANGKLTKKQGERAEAAYRRHLGRLSEKMGPVAAAAEASQAALRDLEFEAKQSKRRKLLQVATQKSIAEQIKTFRGKDGKFTLGAAAEALLARDARDRAPYANVEYRERRRRNEALGLMNKVLQRHSRNVLGSVRDRSGTIDILRELRGEKTGNASAAELADGVRQVQELQRRQFNAAGGAIRKLENRGTAQSHDPVRVMRAGREAWKAKIRDRLDVDKMIDERTGGSFTPETLDHALDYAFDTITTEGAAHRANGFDDVAKRKLNPMGGGGSGSVASRYGDHRFLIFKSADDWLGYAEEFGSTNVYDAIMGETYAMARDIAAMEILGPNPAATVRWLKDAVIDGARRSDGAGSDAVAKAQASADRIDSLWRQLSGANRGQRNLTALIGSTLRAHQVATKLGSAVLTAIPTDMATGALTRAFNGLPVLKGSKDYLAFLASKGAREQAARFAFISEQAGSSFATQARFLGEELTGEVQARLAEGVMRASGLNIHTEAARYAFVHEALAHITDERKTAWSGLGGRFRSMLDRYGLGEAEWDKLRASPTTEMGGAPWILPETIADRKLADRLMEMIYSEMDMAVVTPGVRVQAAVNEMPKKGTVLGEVGRTMFQFKAFPIAAMYMHGARALGMQSGFNKLAYSLAYLSMTTAAGYLAIEAKEIVKGRDARPLSGTKMLFAAMAQGGGLGIYGDFLFSSTNRFGKSASSTFLGPSASTIDGVSGLVAGQTLLAAEGEDVDYDRQLVRLLRSETPGLSSLWWARTAYNRLLLDQWQAAADPDYAQSWNRIEQRAERETGQSHWWRPGDTAPDRAPDLAPLLAAPPEQE